MTLIAELENRAMALSQQGDTQATMRVCQEILAIDRNHLSSLRFPGGHGDSLRRFFSHCKLSDNTAGEFSRRSASAYPARAGALPSRQTGAGDGGLHDYWRIKPDGGTIYLTLGCLYVELGDIDKAAQVFSLGEVVDHDLLSLWKNPDTNPGVSQMSKTAWETLCRHHTELHIAAVDAQWKIGKPQPDPGRCLAAGRHAPANP